MYVTLKLWIHFWTLKRVSTTCSHEFAALLDFDKKKFYMIWPTSFFWHVEMHSKRNICSCLPYENLVIPKKYLSAFVQRLESLDISRKVIWCLLKFFLQFDFRCFMWTCSPVTERLTQYYMIAWDNPLGEPGHYQERPVPRFLYY